MPLTQTDVAREVGVSQKAVTFALSSNPLFNRKLRPETRQRILQAAQRMGYVPDRAARRLARARRTAPPTRFVDQVGMLFLASSDQNMDPVCLTMMSAAETELSAAQAALTFVRVRHADDWGKVERLTRAGGADAWLVYGLVTDDVIDRLDRFVDVPHLILGDHRCDRPVRCVNVDNLAVGQLAVQHLAALGHRRIGFMRGSMLHVYQRRALEGFRAAVKEYGLEDDPRLISDLSSLGTTGHFERNAERFVAWMREVRPTALFSPENQWTAETFAALRDAGLHVPRDVSVLACEYGSLDVSHQKLSRVELPTAEVGRQGAAMLRRLAGDPTDLEPNLAWRRETRIPPTLVQGWSSRAFVET